MSPYDLIVIGSGPGGFRASIEAARRRKRVAVIEQGEIGGTCLNWGCIPTKSLLAVSEMLQQRDSELPADFSRNPNLSDWDKAQLFKDAQVMRLRKGLTGVFKSMKIDVYRGRGVLAGPTSVRVNDQTLEGKAILLAAGSVSTPLPGFEPDGERVLIDKHLLAATELPRSLIILGGGVLGSEFANWLNDFGLEVTIVEMAEQLLPNFDQMVSRALRRRFKQKGIQMKMRAAADHIEKDKHGVRLHLKDGSVLTAEKLLLAVGRRPRLASKILGPVKLETKNDVALVDEYFRTSVPTIYAVGDVIGGPMLAHVAEIQGEYAGRNALGDSVPWPDPPIPACVYTEPEAATVGLGERRANEKGYKTKVGMAYYAMNGRAVASNQTDGLAKVVASADDGKLLGAHICGASATEIIASASTAISLGATVYQLADMVWAHPTYSEVLAEAARACVTSIHD